MPGAAAALLDYGVAARSLSGDGESGDQHLVRVDGRGAFIAVADGLGHGHEAAIAARAAMAVLEAGIGRPLLGLVSQCHEALKGTRGAVMAIAWLEARDQAMSWIAIGNIGGALLHPAGDDAATRRGLLARSGIVGHHLPPLAAATLPLHAGDVLVLATDGVRAGFERDLRHRDPPQDNADRLLARHGSLTDDALILVARWNGSHGRA